MCQNDALIGNNIPRDALIGDALIGDALIGNALIGNALIGKMLFNEHRPCKACQIAIIGDTSQQAERGPVNSQGKGEGRSDVPRVMVQSEPLILAVQVKLSMQLYKSGPIDLVALRQSPCPEQP